jgi:hypothetical protein
MKGFSTSSTTMPTGFKIAELDASREEPEKGGWQDVADGAFTQENRNPFAPPRPKKPPKLAQKKVKARGHVQAHPEYPQIVHTNIPISSIHLAEHQERIVPPAGPVHARSSDSVRDKNRASYAASSANEVSGFHPNFHARRLIHVSEVGH